MSEGVRIAAVFGVILAAAGTEHLTLEPHGATRLEIRYLCCLSG
jgi:hypothetical protein